jgi:hypothetical protein
MIHEASAIGERVETWLLRRWLGWRSEEICNFFDTFRKVQLRLLSQAIAVGF